MCRFGYCAVRDAWFLHKTRMAFARALNAKESGAAEFSDIPTDSYFANAAIWAALNGVTEGVGNGLFVPERDCMCS